MIKFPEDNEYGPYYENYVSKVKGEDVAALLAAQVNDLRFFFKQIPEEKTVLPYKPGKWTYKQLLGHINDTEKIMYFRALCIARNESQELPGFDQDDYVIATDFNSVPLPDFLEDFELTRRSLSYFIKNLNEEASARIGTVNGFATSARALLFIIAGHFEHHLEILRDSSLK
ncbi:MAG TPA: DinB family protein [Cyclobacteriaceae bacterium]|nr:DinB family protein [Cyclobacteriaceae bacterium]